MKRFLVVSILALFLATSAQARYKASEDDIRSFFSIMYGNSLPLGYASTDALGFGLRLTFPLSRVFYLGLTTDIASRDVNGNGGNFSAGLSTDINVVGDLFISGDIGYTYVTDASMNPWEGRYWDAGIHWWPSQYIDIGIMYRENMSTLNNFLMPELRYSLNFLMGKEMFLFLASAINGASRY